MIGPVYADTPDIAQRLFIKLFLSVPEGKLVAFDIPSDNSLTTGIAKEHGMKFELKLFRMYTKEVMKLDLDRVYAFSTMGVALL